ncbi:hypothetical protein Nmel_002529, partial [Mimus melanotis]
MPQILAFLTVWCTARLCIL